MNVNSLSILVVDDDKDNAASLGELFEYEGHRVHVVHSGKEAIDAYINSTFDIAFMDVMMPEKNGVESFFEIRKLRPTARVFMMTGYSVEELLQQAVRGGAMGVLEKPFEASEVLRITQSVGPGGLVVAAPVNDHKDIGMAIHSTLNDAGFSSLLVRDVGELSQPIGAEQVLVLDAHLPLIDAVSSYKDAQDAGHRAPTIVVPRTDKRLSDGTPTLRDVGITGILNKPFDPLDLLTRLQQLAA
jgi:two-component system, NtrC family, response regulator HydG